MSRQYFADAPYNDPCIANQSAIVATTVTALFPPQMIQIPAYDAKAGKVYVLHAHGIYSTGASGTLTISPFWGTTTGGVALGASGAQTVPVSESNLAWGLQAFVYIRTLGAAGANSTAVCHGKWWGSGAIATAGSAFTVAFGSTASVNIDYTIQAGICIGWTLSVAGSCTPMSCVLQSLN